METLFPVRHVFDHFFFPGYNNPYSYQVEDFVCSAICTVQYNYYLHFLFSRKINHSYSARRPHTEPSAPDRALSSHCLPIPPCTLRAVSSHHPPAIHSAPSPVLSSVSVLPHSSGPWAVGTEPWLTAVGPCRCLVRSGCRPVCSGLFPTALDFSPTLFALFFCPGFCLFFKSFFFSPAYFYSKIEG